MAELLRAVSETPSADARHLLPVGTILHDSHRLVRKIGEGGMGTVYEAVHVRLKKKKFAIKILKTSFAANKVPYARFRREAEIATELGHPNIVEVFDFYETETGLPCMVMELLEGEDLEARLERCRHLSPSELIKILDQVGSALQAAHDQGIVHRDLKPANIFLAAAEEQEEIKLLDFGVSKIKHSKTKLTGDVAVFGTPQYMSPEQGMGQTRSVDQTTDIFALGVICYQALSGRLPFDGETIPGTIHLICYEDPTPITDIVPALPRAVHRVLGRALAKARQNRYQGVTHLVEDLKKALRADGKTLEITMRGYTPAMGPRPVARQLRSTLDSEPDEAGVDPRAAAPAGDASPAPSAAAGAPGEAALAETVGSAHQDSLVLPRRWTPRGLWLVLALALVGIGGAAWLRAVHDDPAQASGVAGAGALDSRLSSRDVAPRDSGAVDAGSAARRDGPVSPRRTRPGAVQPAPPGTTPSGSAPVRPARSPGKKPLYRDLDRKPPSGASTKKKIYDTL